MGPALVARCAVTPAGPWGRCRMPARQRLRVLQPHRRLYEREPSEIRISTKRTDAPKPPVGIFSRRAADDGGVIRLTHAGRTARIQRRWIRPLAPTPSHWRRCLTRPRNSVTLLDESLATRPKWSSPPHTQVAPRGNGGPSANLTRRRCLGSNTCGNAQRCTLNPSCCCRYALPTFGA